MPLQLPSTCLSEQPHGNQVSDPAIHINGCLPAAKQRRFYQSLPPESQQRIARIHGKIVDLRHGLETTHYESTAGVRLRDFKRAMTQWCAATGRSDAAYATRSPKFASSSSRAPTPGTPGFGALSDPVENHVKAPVIYFRDGEPCDVPGLPKTFPHQKATVADLLSEDASRNPIMRPAEDGVVRYFHLPANNMAWVEEIIARYYHDKRPEPDDLLHKSRSRRPQSKTEMLLQPGYWQGQRNFDVDSEVHARHMRPFCAGISVDPVAAEPNPSNVVLFMPYLHWETDRGRVRSAEIVKEASKQNLISISEVVDQAKHQFSHVETQDTVVPPVTTWTSQSAAQTPAKVERRPALGQVFRAAAALLEAMDTHVEEQLMLKYLHVEPPLQPRRTLDQAYYGALKSTGTRDRDQVVYRGTTPQTHECEGMETCLQCNEDIRKTPRIIMVDQLWLWILDESKWFEPPESVQRRPLTPQQTPSSAASHGDGAGTDRIPRPSTRACAHDSSTCARARSRRPTTWLWSSSTRLRESSSTGPRRTAASPTSSSSSTPPFEI